MTDQRPTPKTLRHNPLDDLMAPPAAARPASFSKVAAEAPPTAVGATPHRPAGAAPAGGQYLTFRLHGERFAADILQVREILELAAITRVPKTPPWVHGVMNLRGTVVPVIDLAAKLGLPACAPTRHTCIVVTDVDPRDTSTVLGLLVDRVEEVLDVADDRVQPPPDFGTTVHPSYLEGLAETGDGLALVVDLLRVLSAPELDAADGWSPAGELHAAEPDGDESDGVEP